MMDVAFEINFVSCRTQFFCKRCRAIVVFFLEIHGQLILDQCFATVFFKQLEREQALQWCFGERS